MVQKVQYTDRSGKKKRSSLWYATFRDLAGKWQRVPGFTDKRLTEKLETRLRRLVELRQNLERPTGELSRWIDSLPERTRGQLVKYRLLDQARSTASRSTEELIVAFEDHLRARGTTATHVGVQASRVRRALEHSGCLVVGDLCVDSARTFLSTLREDGRSTRTTNGYVQALRQFTGWLCREGVLGTDPFANLERSEKSGRVRTRRAMAEPEAQRLIQVTRTLSSRFGMTGAERALLYRLCIETGLRRREVTTLERRALELDGDPPTLWVQGRYAKNRREAFLPLRRATADILRGHVSNMMPTARVFKMTHNHRTAEMLRADLRDAEIAVTTSDGVLDFHSLRHTMITRLARSGVHPKVAQELARHSTITLTMDVYSHMPQQEQVRAIEAMPALAE